MLHEPINSWNRLLPVMAQSDLLSVERNIGFSENGLCPTVGISSNQICFYVNSFPFPFRC